VDERGNSERELLKEGVRSVVVHIVVWSRLDVALGRGVVVRVISR